MMKDAAAEFEIELALSVLCAITPPGFHWTIRDIAEVCGCTKSKIECIQIRASKKFAKAARARHLHEYLKD
jgi:hypothetical protein